VESSDGGAGVLFGLACGRRHCHGGGVKSRKSTMLTGMMKETVIALRNYDWMVRDRGLDNVALAWDSETLVYGDGGTGIEALCEPGLTPATADEAPL